MPCPGMMAAVAIAGARTQIVAAAVARLSEIS
jgi:hypothetical protein